MMIKRVAPTGVGVPNCDVATTAGFSYFLRQWSERRHSSLWFNYKVIQLFLLQTKIHVTFRHFILQPLRRRWTDLSRTQRRRCGVENAGRLTGIWNEPLLSNFKVQCLQTTSWNCTTRVLPHLSGIPRVVPFCGLLLQAIAADSPGTFDT